MIFRLGFVNLVMLFVISGDPANLIINRVRPNFAPQIFQEISPGVFPIWDCLTELRLMIVLRMPLLCYQPMLHVEHPQELGISTGYVSLSFSAAEAHVRDTYHHRSSNEIVENNKDNNKSITPSTKAYNLSELPAMVTAQSQAVNIRPDSEMTQNPKKLGTKDVPK
jgi:hypothetical protein